MAVFRVDRNINYTTMANFHFKDKKLSWKAKGILSTMLSLPENWDYSLAGLVKLSSDGASATRTALKELEEAGYLIRRQIRKNGKIVDWEYLIFEKPQLKKPLLENQQVENPLVENQTQLNTNELNTKESITKESITKEEKKVSKSKQNSFDEILSNYTQDEETLDLLGEWLKVRKAKRAAMTDRAIQMNVEKLDLCAKQSGLTVKAYLKEVICRGWAAFYVIQNYSNKKRGANGIALAEESHDLDDIL